MRDLRDPEKLGLKIQHLREGSAPVPLSMVIDSMPLTVADYSCDRMSNDPAAHHSRTPQNRPVEPDGGE